MKETTVNGKWLVKIAIFMVALAALGVWGLLDATVYYPARGAAAEQWARYEYLQAADDSGELLLTTVGDPRAELDRLRPLRNDLAHTASGETLTAKKAATELKRLGWLESAATIGRLTPKYTAFTQPRAELDELDNALASQAQPKPLAAWDIPLQWGFVAVGFAGAGWLLLLIVSVSRRKYRFDPETLTLTLLDGRAITPEQLTELDKRKWDKFLVTLRLKDGGSAKLDLLRYSPLEEWVLEMEKAAGLAEETDEPATPAPESDPPDSAEDAPRASAEA